MPADGLPQGTQGDGAQATTQSTDPATGAAMIDPTVSAYYVGDCRKLLKRLPDACVQTCITSSPYWGLRDEDVKGQIGLEPTQEKYVRALVRVFDEVWRVLKDDGTLWLVIGDSYAGSRSGPQGQSGQMANRAVSKHRGMLSKTKGIDPKNPRKGPGSNDAPNRQRQRGLKHKDLVGIPWMAAFALRDAGWYLRMDNIWSKPNPMPESVTDRTTKSHEYIFHFSKSANYYYDAAAIAEPVAWDGQDRTSRDAVATAMPGAPSHRGLRKEAYGDTRNKRSVWTVTPTPYNGAHFATFPPALIEPCVLACSRPGDLVLDPFFGSGTTGEVAEKHERRWIGFDINPKYAALARERTAQRSLPLARPASP
jgi:DNA modification methylase